MTNKTTTDTFASDLIERASKLNENGAHYFVGWLISAGMQRPEVMTELERVLREFETAPNPQDCFAAEAKPTKKVRPAAKTVAPADETQPTVPRATGSQLHVNGSASEIPEKTSPPASARRQRQPSFPKKFLQALFGKSSIAA
jgi:hypothetical protein